MSFRLLRGLPTSGDSFFTGVFDGLPFQSSGDRVSFEPVFALGGTLLNRASCFRSQSLSSFRISIESVDTHSDVELRSQPPSWQLSWQTDETFSCLLLGGFISKAELISVMLGLFKLYLSSGAV